MAAARNRLRRNRALTFHMRRVHKKRAAHVMQLSLSNGNRKEEMLTWLDAQPQSFYGL
jgi:hypothetical protein